MLTPTVWLAKSFDAATGAMVTSVEDNLRNDSYSMTVSLFDPRGIDKAEATRLGIKTSVWGEKWGKRFGAQIWHMAHSVKHGDWIFIESSNRHIRAYGQVTGPYRHNPKVIEACKKERKFTVGLHEIPVDWTECEDGADAVSISRGDNLVFRNTLTRPELRDQLMALVKVRRRKPAKRAEMTTGDDEPAETPENPPSVETELTFEEGEVILRTHLDIERSAAAAKVAKDQARKRGDGKIKCVCCGKAPADIYGVEIIDAHHVVPLKDTKGMARTPTPADFEMLCPTCHRAVHHVLAGKKAEGRDAIEVIRRKVLRRH